MLAFLTEACPLDCRPDRGILTGRWLQAVLTAAQAPGNGRFLLPDLRRRLLAGTGLKP